MNDPIQKPGSVDALLLAAGSGSRMTDATGGKNKVLLKLGGVEIFIHSFRKLIRSPLLRKIIVVHRDGEEKLIRSAIDRERVDKEVCLVVGGTERFDSVYRGLCALEVDPPEFVMIHDSARPFLKDRFIEDSIRQVRVHRACTVAVPLTDTLKRMEGDVLIETLPRENLYRIQTPQTFDYSFLREAHIGFQRQPEIGVTDDCMLLEKAGHPIGLVLGEESNIKVTTSFDLDVANSILQEGSETLAK